MEPIPEVCEDSCSQIGGGDEAGDGGRSIARRGAAAHSYETRCARCKAMGSVQIVTVHAGDRELELHKCPLVARSGYLTRVFRSSSHLSLPPDFPGGPPAFDLVLRFCLGVGFAFDPSNVAVLRCAAEYLEMNREVASNNLCERAELYLYHVALREWGGAIQVIRSACSSEPLILLADDTQILATCVDAISSMLTAEFRVNNARFRHFGGKATTALARSSNGQGIGELLRLPFPILGRIITACRRKGAAEQSVCHLLVKYVEKWLFAEGLTDEEQEDVEEEENSQLTEEQMLEILESVIRLLPFERGAIAVSFLFALLRYSIAVGARRECRLQLESRIASQLDLACIADLLMPFKTAVEAPTLIPELDSMKRIVSLFMTQHSRNSCTSTAVMVDWEAMENVGRVWDEYLAEIAYSSGVSSLRFAELVDAVPAFVRVSHDELYRAILIFLKAHPSASQQERTVVCKSLDCQKLSQEACIHLVQNEMMPLRTIVQAMFAQQLHTRSVMNHSFRRLSNSNLASVSKRAFLAAEEQQMQQQQHCMYQGSCEEMPLMSSSCGSDEPCGLKADLEATNCKLVSLEKQLVSLKQALQVGADDSSSGLTTTGLTTTATSTSSSTRDHHHQRSSSSSINIKSSKQLHPSQNLGVGRKITKALQRMGLASGLCKQQCEEDHHLTPGRCFPTNAGSSSRNIHPRRDEADDQLLEPPRLSVGKEERRRGGGGGGHHHRYSIS